MCYPFLVLRGLALLAAFTALSLVGCGVLYVLGGAINAAQPANPGPWWAALTLFALFVMWLVGFLFAKLVGLIARRRFPASAP